MNEQPPLTSWLFALSLSDRQPGRRGSYRSPSHHVAIETIVCSGRFLSLTKPGDTPYISFPFRTCVCLPRWQMYTLAVQKLVLFVFLFIFCSRKTGWKKARWGFPNWPFWMMSILTIDSSLCRHRYWRYRCGSSPWSCVCIFPESLESVCSVAAFSHLTSAVM